MILGLNGKLEREMLELRNRPSERQLRRLMELLAESVAAGDWWYVPVEPMAEGLNETDVEDWAPLGSTRMCKRTIRSAGRRLFCVFTEEALLERAENDQVVSIRYPARQFLEEIAGAEELDGLMFNPWTSHFTVKLEHVRTLLRAAEEIDPETAAAHCSVWIRPRAVLDTNEMLREWSEGWKDGGETPIEDWKLHSWPIMPNGNLLAVYSMTGGVRGGKYGERVEHKLHYFRVLEYAWEDEGLECVGKYRFRVQDAWPCWVHVVNGVLYAVLRSKDGPRFTLLQTVPADDERQLDLFNDVERTLFTSDGRLIVGYWNNQRDRTSLPLIVKDLSGKLLDFVKDEDALGCADINLDAEERCWYHLFPSDRVIELDLESGERSEHRVALQGFSGFALSDDREKMLAAFEGYHSESVLYVLTRNAKGDYICPMRFCFEPEDGNGEPLRPWDCETFGAMSAMKSRAVLNAGGRLYCYDVNELHDEQRG